MENTKKEVKKELLYSPQLGMHAYHESIHNGKELMKVVGIRETEVELEGNYSVGTHQVLQKDWLPIKGLFRLRKVCEQIQKYGTCTLHNVQCSYPNCEPYIDSVHK